MNIVPVGAVDPVVLEIVDDELEVRRHPRRLDGGEVHAENFGAGEEVCDFYGPYPWLGVSRGAPDGECAGGPPVPVPMSRIFCGLSPIGA